MGMGSSRPSPAPLLITSCTHDGRRLAPLRNSPDLRLHDLRHAHAQWLSDNGIPEARIQTAMRHRTPSMTRRYTVQRDKGETARTLGEVLFRPAIGPAMVLDERAG